MQLHRDGMHPCSAPLESYAYKVLPHLCNTWYQYPTFHEVGAARLLSWLPILLFLSNSPLLSLPLKNSETSLLPSACSPSTLRDDYDRFSAGVGTRLGWGRG